MPCTGTLVHDCSCHRIHKLYIHPLFALMLFIKFRFTFFKADFVHNLLLNLLGGVSHGSHEPVRAFLFGPLHSYIIFSFMLIVTRTSLLSVSWLSLLYKFTRFFIYFLFLSDEWPMLETLDYNIRIGSTPTILYSFGI